MLISCVCIKWVACIVLSVYALQQGIEKGYCIWAIPGHIESEIGILGLRKKPACRVSRDISTENTVAWGPQGYHGITTEISSKDIYRYKARKLRWLAQHYTMVWAGSEDIIEKESFPGGGMVVIFVYDILPALALPKTMGRGCLHGYLGCEH